MAKKYIISCDYYRKVPATKMLGPTTLAVSTEYESEPFATVYLRGYENPKEPRLNVKDLAMEFDSEKEAQKIANELNANTWDEGKIVATVVTK